jgi:hypothetical protein
MSTLACARVMAEMARRQEALAEAMRAARE